MVKGQVLTTQSETWKSNMIKIEYTLHILPYSSNQSINKMQSTMADFAFGDTNWRSHPNNVALRLTGAAT